MKKVKNIMDKNYEIVDIVFVLDKSGSMSGLESDTIGGFNSFVEKQKKVDGKAYLTLVVFDTQCKVIYDRVDIKEVSPLTSKDYSPSGCTALYDAIGLAIDKEITQLNFLRDMDTPSKVIFNIITDGEENSSREYSLSSIKSKIKELEEDDWTFSFLGANIDSFADSRKIGITHATNFSHTNIGMRSVYDTLSSNIASHRNDSYVYANSCTTSSCSAPNYTPNFNNVK